MAGASTTAAAQSSALAQRYGVTFGWLRGVRFDAVLIFGTLALAVAGGLYAAAQPEMWPHLLMVFMLSLGLHHIVATYTRLGFDRQSLREHWVLVVIVPVLVLAGVVTALFAVGYWLLFSVYFYWQWWHFTRQSYGMERMYWRKAGGAGPDWPTRAVIYAVPVWAVLNRSSQHHFLYLGNEIRWLPVPNWVVLASGAIALGAAAVWAVSRVRLARREPVRVAHIVYVVTHIAIFVLSYELLANPDHGWLAISIWHSLQYVMIVWMFQANRFKAGVDPRRRLISTLSQPRNAWAYLAICIGLGALIYFGIRAAGDVVRYNGVQLILLLYPVVNFHHYIVDAVIWKLRKKPVSEHLGLARPVADPSASPAA